MKIIIIAVLLCIVYTQNCSVIYDSQFQVFATINETKQWDMRKNFFNGENLRYEISGGCPYFETQDPIQQISNSSHAKQVTGKILKFKARRIPENGVWINDFIFLEQNQTDYNIYYSKGQQDSVPNFSKRISVASTSSDFDCYDLEFFTETNVIVDCQRKMDDGEIVNGFIVVDLINSQYYDIFFNVHPEEYQYNYTEQRKILFHNYPLTNVGEEQDEGGLSGNTVQLLFRGEPAWATEYADSSKDLLDDDCELEVYKFVNNKLVNDGMPIAVLTKDVLADLLKQDPTKQKFYLMDFQIQANGEIFVLDAYQGIFVLYLGQDFNFKLKSRFAPLNQSICYGFDFNYLINSDGYTKHTVLLFKDSASFFENNYVKFTIKLPELASYGSLSASLSQQYFVLQSRNTQKIYLYNSKDGQQLYAFNATQLSKILVNPYTPEMIGINTQSAYKFSLTQGLLKLLKQEKVNGGLKTCVIKAQASDIICQLAVSVQILSNNDTSIYQQYQRSLPYIITAPLDSIKLGVAASGPNLQYDVFLNNLNQKLNLILPTTKQAWNLNLNGIQMIQPWDVYYADIQVFDDDREFFILLQSSKKIVYIYKCIHEIEDNQNAKCSDFEQFPLNILIPSSKKNFYWQIQCSVLVFIYKENDYSIQFYAGINGKISNVGQIQFDKSQSENKITDITFQSNYIFLVQGLKQNIQVWSTSTPYQLIYEINNQVQTVFNIQETFQPIRVHKNNKANNNLILIQTNLFLQVGVFESQKMVTNYIILKNLPILENADVEVAIGEKSFFVIQKQDSIDLIEEYSFEQLDNIKKIKELPLYHYQLQKPLTVDATSQKGWLFVRAQHNQQTVILVYKPNELAHNSLYKVIETNTFDFNLKTFDLTVDGEEQIFIYYNNQTTQNVIALLEETQVIFNSNSNQFYVNELIATLKISNFQAITPLQTNYQVTILDTMVSIEINQTLFDKKQKVFPFIKQNETQYIDMGTDWYVGQVLNFQVSCNFCGENLQIRQKMNIINVGSDMIYDISDGSQYGKNGQVYQTRNSIVFQSIQGKFQSIRKIPTTTQNCELITVSKDQEFIISTWNDYRKSEMGVFINQCTTESICLQFKQGFETINGISSIEKIKMVDNKNILILSQDINSQNDGILLVTQFSYTSQSYSISNTYTINDAYVGSKFLQIGDFDYISYTINGNSYSTIIFTDLNNGLYFSHFSINSQGILVKTVSEQVKLRQLEKDQYFLYDDTKFQQVKVINQILSGTVLQLNILVTTSNAASYVFGFDLDASKPNFGVPIIKSKTQLLYTLVPYGNWESVNKISVLDQHVAIPFTDSTKVMIAIYEIPNARPSETKVITFTHGIDADYHKILPQDFALVFNKIQGAVYPYLFTNINYYFNYDEYLIESYEFRSDPQLVLSNSKNLADEVQIRITLSNEFYKAEGQAYLKANQAISNDNAEVSNIKLQNLRGGNIEIEK